jgi:hypothetical protein
MLLIRATSSGYVVRYTHVSLCRTKSVLMSVTTLRPADNHNKPINSSSGATADSTSH